jgi:hypothetical protein
MCFVHFPLLAPDPSDGNGVDDIDDARLSINVAIAELMVLCLPAAFCREHVLRIATVAPLLDVAQTLIDDLGSDAQRLQLFDAFGLLVQDAAAGRRRSSASASRCCAASSYGSTPVDSLLPELELIIGCIVALSRMLWQLKDSDVDASLSLFDTMLGVCAPATPPRLHAAARSNLADVVAMLLDAGADPHQREPDGSTALHWACRQSAGHRCAQLLLDGGCDVNAASQQHMTPLMRVGSPRTAELLLERGALVNAIDVDGWTPMFWCVLEGDQRETIRADGEPRSRAVESHTRLRGPEESAEAPRNARDVRRIEHAQTREDADPHALN